MLELPCPLLQAGLLPILSSSQVAGLLWELLQHATNTEEAPASGIQKKTKVSCKRRLERPGGLGAWLNNEGSGRLLRVWIYV